MLNSFYSIDSYLQHQLFRLMKIASDDIDTRRGIYFGYSAIRNRMMEIIDKIKDYYRIHSKLNSIYSIDDMYIGSSLRPRFIIPSLTEDVYVVFKNEIKSYINGLNTSLSDLVNSATILDELHDFERNFIDCCYHSLYLALCEYGTLNPYDNISYVLDTLTRRNYFTGYKIYDSDIASLLNFPGLGIKSLMWNNYLDRFSITHSEYKKYKRMLKEDSLFYDLDDDEYDLLDGDDIYYKYIKDNLVDVVKKKMDNDKKVEKTKKKNNKKDKKK